MMAFPLRKIGVLHVPVISLGTALWGSQLSAQDAHTIADSALDHGVNFIDTAEGYPAPMTPETHGTTEQILGTWLGDRDRSQLIICSKVYGPSENFRPCETTLNANEMCRALTGTLARLCTDYLDLYLLHWPDQCPENQQAQAAAMGGFVKSGLIREWGLSNCPFETFEAYQLAAQEVDAPEPVIVQNSFSIVSDPHRVVEASVPLMAYGVLGHGILSGQYCNGVPKTSRMAWLKSAGQEIGLVHTGKIARFIADSKLKGADPVRSALQFALDQSFTLNCCVGFSNPAQVDQVVAGFENTGNLNP